MTATTTPTYIGARVARKEDPRLITGEGTFTDDVTLPGMAYLTLVRSPHAHARSRPGRRRLRAASDRGRRDEGARGGGADRARGARLQPRLHVSGQGWRHRQGVQGRRGQDQSADRQPATDPERDRAAGGHGE